MPHIHTQPGDHDLTTTAFIIRTDTPEPVGFLHRHRTLDILLPVGGHVEVNESPWAAILHEIVEESGYDISQLHVLQPADRIISMDQVRIHPVPLFLQTHEFSANLAHYHSDIGFAFITNQPPAHLPAEGESSDIRWMTNRMIQRQRASMPPDIAQIYDFCFSVALERWQPVELATYDL